MGIKKLTALLLAAVMVVGMTALSGVSAVDDGDDGEGMVLGKSAVYNSADDTTTVTLEAYATGDAVISIVESDIPTDIILVLDQSGSMSEDMGTVRFDRITGNNRRNSSLYERRHNGGSSNLWHDLGDGAYASVSVTRELAYSPINGQNNGYYYNNRNNIYHLSGGVYYPVTVTRTGVVSYTYRYTSDAGLDVTSSGRYSTPSFGSEGPLYLGSDTDARYTYYYTDGGGSPVEIADSTGANTVLTSPVLYSRTVSAGGGTKLAALTAALEGFVSSVYDKAAGNDGAFGTDDDVNHRVAIVGFASESGNGNNTELLSIAGTNSGTVGVAYNNITAQNYTDVLQSVDTSSGRTMVNRAIAALAASGATRADLGMLMARNILQRNPVPDGEVRNRVVVMFTDGAPTAQNGFQIGVADQAISYSATVKNNYEATVYAVGVFANADPSSPGTRPSGNLGENSAQLPAACNWFMHNVSSNNGTVQSPGYYLAASDAASLANIFQQIADQIQTGGATTTLDEQTVIRDVISPSFALPEGATADDIILETWACTGVDSNGEYTWSKNPDAMGASVTIGSTDSSDETTTDNQINVTGFDFAENYVGTVTSGDTVTYRGNKLVIRINVVRREGFFGGNQVVTNTSAGVYENAEAEEPILTFEQPTLDIPLLDMSVNVADDDRYLGSYYLQSVPEDAIKLDASINIGGYELDLTKPNFGLEPWQNEYVDIIIEAAAEGNGGSFEDVVEDITYTVTLTVKPKYEGTVGSAGQSATGSGTIHVFLPSLTYRDSEAYYGDTVSYGSSNLVSSTWKNRADGTGHHDEDVVMLNTEPTPGIVYTPKSGAIVDGKAATAGGDIPVKAAVSLTASSGSAADITALTSFEHIACDPACGWTAPATSGDPAFLIHVRTCTLTVTKTGGREGDPYVFDILKDGEKYTGAVIVGNGTVTIGRLPTGTYTVVEDENWSWRFDADTDGAAVLSAASPEGAVTCENTPNGNIYWLSAYSQVVSNAAAQGEGKGE